jgi:hypothetical protein
MTLFEGFCNSQHIPKPESSTELWQPHINQEQMSKLSLPQIDRLYSAGLLPLHMLPVLCPEYVEPQMWADVQGGNVGNICIGQFPMPSQVIPANNTKTQQKLLKNQQNRQKKNRARRDKRPIKRHNEIYPASLHRKSRVTCGTYALQQPRSTQKGFGPRIGKSNLSPTRTS